MKAIIKRIKEKKVEKERKGTVSQRGGEQIEDGRVRRKAVHKTSAYGELEKEERSDKRPSKRSKFISRRCYV